MTPEQSTGWLSARMDWHQRAMRRLFWVRIVLVGVYLAAALMGVLNFAGMVSVIGGVIVFLLVSWALIRRESWHRTRWLELDFALWRARLLGDQPGH